MVADCALACDRWNSVAFIDERFAEIEDVLGFPVLGAMKDIEKLRPDFPEVVVAIGDNRRRIEVQNSLGRLGFQIATLIHPTATLGRAVEIGEGSVVFAQAVVNPGSILGRGCIVNTAASIDHDCKLGDGVHISPGANLGGGVEIGSFSWIGVGAAVIQCCKVGGDVVIGAGAAVTEDIREGVTAVGVPAKVISEKR